MHLKLCEMKFPFYFGIVKLITHSSGELVVELRMEPDTMCWKRGSSLDAGTMVVLTTVAEENSLELGDHIVPASTYGVQILGSRRREVGRHHW